MRPLFRWVLSQTSNMEYMVALGVAILATVFNPLLSTTVHAVTIVDELSEKPVTQLEWGVLRLEQAVRQNFEIDPNTLKTYLPPFYTNVNFEADKARIVIEIGRTFAQFPQDNSKAECRDYINRVRSMLSVDRLGQPSIYASSAVYRDYFRPLIQSGEPDRELGKALDEIVHVRAVVAAPMSGVYAICAAELTGAKIHFVD